jgi:NAD-dependent DNA ligase
VEEVDQSVPIKLPKKIKKPKLIIVENEINIEPYIQLPNQPMQRWNEKFVDVLEQLEKIMLRTGEPFKARAYSNAKETILSMTEDITSVDQLKGKKAMGEAILKKLEIYAKEGKLDLIEKEKNNPLHIFSEIYGVGPKKAKELVEKYQLTTLDQLKERKDELLNDKQQIGLKYYEDIQQRIPRAEIEKYKEKFTQIFNSVAKDENAKFEIVGSYRRGAKDSGDIDVIITGTTNDVYKTFVQELFTQHILIESLSSGNTKALTISQLTPKSTPRRIDFLYSTLEEFPFSILYFTGSKGFNTVMRGKALEMGYTMNEHRIINKKTGEKPSVEFTDEKSIFDFLHLQYKKPEERIDGRAVTVSANIEPVVATTVESVTEPTVESAVESVKKKRIVKKKITIEPTAELTNEMIPAPVVSTEKTPKKRSNKITISENSKPKTSPQEFIHQFREKGASLLDSMSQKELEEVLTALNVLYRNDTPLATDNEYDIIEDYIKKKYPNNETVKQIGAPVEKNKVKLPYEMWSMDKIKPDSNALANWKTTYKGPYVVSCKLDGVSGMYIHSEDGTSKLYTRGDGKVGQDITNLIPYLKLPKNKGMVIRGEFIMDKHTFQTKYAENFANPRNLVSGIINRQTADDKIKDIRFVAYEVIVPSLTPSKQMELLTTLDIDVVQNEVLPDVTNETLSKILQEWRVSSEYQIDGIIVANDQVYPRTSGNPKHAFAFKMVLSDQVAEAKVVDVVWSASKDGYLKPRVKIEPIQLGGVKIEFATGFNAAFIEKNKIGVGAVIEMIRSGDVIPYINKVIEPAMEAKMPTEEYEWNSTHVDIILKDKSANETVTIKNIAGFFKGLEVDGLGEGNVARIVKKGYNTIPKVVKMTPEDFAGVEGFQAKMVTKIYNGIREKLNQASLSAIMSHSNLLGRGFSSTKIDAIMSAYPDVLTSTDSEETKVSKISKIKGFSAATATTFVKNIPVFLTFIEECGLQNKLMNSEVQAEVTVHVDTSSPLYKKGVLMTGFRDKVLEEKIKDRGGVIAASIRKDLLVVLTKDKMDMTGKLLKARELKLPIMTPDEFTEKYLA